MKGCYSRWLLSPLNIPFMVLAALGTVKCSVQTSSKIPSLNNLSYWDPDETMRILTRLYYCTLNQNYSTIIITTVQIRTHWMQYRKHNHWHGKLGLFIMGLFDVTRLYSTTLEGLERQRLLVRYITYLPYYYNSYYDKLPSSNH